MKETRYTLITDIGSTTTKAVLIDRLGIKLIGIQHANTTVEAPDNDVKIGVFNAVKNLESRCQIPLLSPSANPHELIFAPEVEYLSTSSAGGGLQILVIGLTLFDSASSAKRAAYGAGGIILDVFAIDDRRSSVEQMLAMRNLRPDMILLCGGTDGGAISTVLRLAEILRIAKPMPKFSTSVKIPAIYAGNKGATEMITGMISKDFDLHIMPNLRPKINEENLKPTQEIIQTLFMENVMERAPGYGDLINIVSSAILPTPAGVMQSLGIMEQDAPRNSILFDIGGATTDVFTRINGHFQRTVSANLGMSFSALNVLKESDIPSVLKFLPESISEAELRNYTGNKTLFPTMNPGSPKEFRIEHALAKCAIKHSFIQHQIMHYNTKKIGYLDALKNNGKDKYEQKFNYIENEKLYYFYPSDINVVIGAGGVFAHAPGSNECIDILISGFQPVGITELAIDQHFISPHLGVLSTVNEASAQELLSNECIKRLAIHIRPIFPPKKGFPVLQVEHSDGKKMIVQTDTVEYLPAMQGRTLRLVAQKKCMIDGDTTQIELNTDLPIIIDTRFDLEKFDPRIEGILGLYETEGDPTTFENHSREIDGTYTYEVDLPYNGDIMYQVGDNVSPDDIVAQNRYEPPRLFVVNMNSSNVPIAETASRNAITVQTGDEVTYSQVLRKAIPELGLNTPRHSPVRGKVEFIDYKACLLVLSEIQKYSDKPVSINLAEKMGVKPRMAARFLNKQVGEFVYEGDILAKNIASGQVSFVNSPITGKVIEFNPRTAEIVLQYQSKPYLYPAHVKGVVREVEQNKAIQIEYRGKRLEASIGWGKAVHGILHWLEDASSGTIPQNSIVVCRFMPDLNQLQHLAKNAVAIICPALQESVLADYLGLEPGVINTGQEVLPASLILVQGFGELNYKPHQLAFMRENHGKLCMVDPHTRIRAGVVRASINIIDS